MFSRFINIFSEISEVQEFRNCLNVSVNRFIFTPRPSSYDFFTYSEWKDDDDEKESDSSQTNTNNPNHSSASTLFTTETIFIPIAIENRYRYDVPCVWIHNKNTSSSSSSQQQQNPIMLYFHGTSSNIGNHVEELTKIAEKVTEKMTHATINFDILLVEYPGYGIASSFLPSIRSGHVPNDKKNVYSSSFDVVPTDFLFSERGGALFHTNTDKLRLIGEKVLEFVINRRRQQIESGSLVQVRSIKADNEEDVRKKKKKKNEENNSNSKDIILIGRSMGTGLVLELAANENFSQHISSVILLAPYTSIPRVISEFLTKKVGNFLGGKILFPIIKFFLLLSNSDFFHSDENVKKIAKESIIKRKNNLLSILSFHGDKDTLIDKQHTNDLNELFLKTGDGDDAKNKNLLDGKFLKIWDPNGTHGEIDFHDGLIQFLVKKFLSSSSSESSSYLKNPIDGQNEQQEVLLMPDAVRPKSKTELKLRKARFEAEKSEAEKLKKKALFTLRFIILTTVVLTFGAIIYSWYF